VEEREIRYSILPSRFHKALMGSVHIRIYIVIQKVCFCIKSYFHYSRQLLILIVITSSLMPRGGIRHVPRVLLHVSALAVIEFYRFRLIVNGSFEK
jgi:hypothetical protein